MNQLWKNGSIGLITGEFYFKRFPILHNSMIIPYLIYRCKGSKQDVSPHYLYEILWFDGYGLHVEHTYATNDAAASIFLVRIVISLFEVFFVHCVYMYLNLVLPCFALSNLSFQFRLEAEKQELIDEKNRLSEEITASKELCEKLSEELSDSKQQYAVKLNELHQNHQEAEEKLKADHSQVVLRLCLIWPRFD